MTDKRIQYLLEKRRQSENAVLTTSSDDTSHGQTSYLDMLRTKWISDVETIASRLTVLNQKLAPLGVEFTHNAAQGRPGSTLGSADFFGAGPKGDGIVTVDAFENGDVRVYFNRKPANQFYLNRAGISTYESILLDFAELLI